MKIYINFTISSLLLPAEAPALQLTCCNLLYESSTLVLYVVHVSDKRCLHCVCHVWAVFNADLLITFKKTVHTFIFIIRVIVSEAGQQITTLRCKRALRVNNYQLVLYYINMYVSMGLYKINKSNV